DGPAGFGLPPVVDHRYAQMLQRPLHRIGIGAFTGKEQRLQIVQLIATDPVAVRVLAADGAQRGRRGEKAFNAKVLDGAPEDAGMRGADRLALEYDGGGTRDQRAVAYIAVANYPADIRGGPETVSGLDVIDICHRPLQRDQMA